MAKTRNYLRSSHASTRYLARRYESDRLKSLRNEYDYIFIDTPPSWGMVAKMAAHASDIIIAPIDNEEFPTEALYRAKHWFLVPEEFPDSYPPQLHSCVIYCKYSGDVASRAVDRIQARIQELKVKYQKCIIRHYAATSKSISKGKPVVLSAPNTEAAKNFKELAESIFLAN